MSQDYGSIVIDSRQLRCLVHEHVTSISIQPYNTKLNGPRAQSQIAELQVLTNGNWPHLQHLSIRFRDHIEMGAITQLSTASWSSLTSLNLSNTDLGTDAMSQLVLGKWPALKRLNLFFDSLDAAAIASLTQADWPLEELQFGYNRIGAAALQNLAQGRWPKLARLDLKMNHLNVDTIAVLAKVQWPLQHLNLAHNALYAGDLTHLGRQTDLGTLVGAGSGVAPAETIGKLYDAVAWPQLVSLDLGSNCLRGADVAGLCMAHWPKLKMLNLTCNCLGKVSMMHLIKADWPELEYLNLYMNSLDDAAVEVLSHNTWHKLECLILARNKEVSEKAASFLSIKQLRVTIF